MTDLTKIDRPFGLLDEATQRALRECGGPWEIFSTQGWVDYPQMVFPQWEGPYTYRQKPQPPKPREWWIVASTGQAFPVEPPQEPPVGSFYVHVREVMPE